MSNNLACTTICVMVLTLDRCLSCSANKFINSRIVFYPGSGCDGQAVRVLGSAHVAHCFIYADYAVSRTSQLDGSNKSFRGYRSISRISLKQHEILPSGWQPHSSGDHRYCPDANGWGFFEVLEREQDYDEHHGPKRLCILFLGADGSAAYDALFCQNASQRLPFVLYIVDHGWKGIPGRFGRGDLLESIANRCSALPEWILVDNVNNAWRRYEMIPDAKDEEDGMRRSRYLFKKTV